MWKELGLKLNTPTDYSGLDLLSKLQVKAEQLLDLCLVLEQDQACVNSAVQRVLDKSRPSHKRELKYSIHLQHCLELARRIRQNGFQEKIIFVSANREDYGPESASHIPHAELQIDFAQVNMMYFESLGNAIKHIGI